ncbi:hypothetical protein N7519_006481 [Penicillium mononematosum]|uniref:uncharacterized protein n=1 Tax=Penicillium mononematosum TaxID=268346 RepID=UPI002547DCDA|nr:uncharacterized protein N7519_006481 [Penicillium mononematosum]KAJ6185180.1 hypothetical protein N7519_006481 [Penicillium mononematosum]
MELLASDAYCFMFSGLDLHERVAFNAPRYFVEARDCVIATFLMSCGDLRRTRSKIMHISWG